MNWNWGTPEFKLMENDSMRIPISQFLNRQISKDRDIYEFGVHKCETLLFIEKCFIDNNIEYNNIYGFDSFTGFPDWNTELKIDPDTFGLWGSLDFRVRDYPEFLKLVEQKFNKKPTFVVGYYEESCKDSIVSEYNMKPASIVHIDCDFYTSTFTALDFMFRNNLIIKDTIIIYDEWGPLFKSGYFGEERAHDEIMKKYNINTKMLMTIADKAVFIVC